MPCYARATPDAELSFRSLGFIDLRSRRINTTNPHTITNTVVTPASRITLRMASPYLPLVGSYW